MTEKDTRKQIALSWEILQLYEQEWKELETELNIKIWKHPEFLELLMMRSKELRQIKKKDEEKAIKKKDKELKKRG